MKRNERKMNTKELLNALLERLVGRRSAKLWWKSPNKGFNGRTPIALCKGSSKDQMEVKLYLIKAVMQEGS